MTLVRAPYDGFVVGVQVSGGQEVATGTALVELDDLDVQRSIERLRATRQILKILHRTLAEPVIQRSRRKLRAYLVSLSSAAVALSESRRASQIRFEHGEATPIDVFTAFYQERSALVSLEGANVQSALFDPTLEVRQGLASDALAQVETELAHASSMLEKLRIRAPLSGTVGEIAVGPGSFVEAGELVLEILR